MRVRRSGSYHRPARGRLPQPRSQLPRALPAPPPAPESPLLGRGGTEGGCIPPPPRVYKGPSPHSRAAELPQPPGPPPHRRALRNRPTRAEAVLWSALKGRRLDGFKFRRQHSLGPSIVDVYCPAARLAVEVDGGVHADPARAAADAERQRWIERHGIRVVRVTNGEVLRQLDVAVERIRQALADLPLSPSSPEEGGLRG